MEKHAYLIMAHAQFDLLKKLLRALDHEANDIYLHIDRKAGPVDEQEFQDCMRDSRLVFTKRLSVVWAGESQIACEMLLFASAAKEGSYRYYHLLSGVDFPIRTQEEIHAFFEEHDGREFIEYWDRPEKEYLYRIRYRYPLQEKIGRYTSDPKTLVLRILSKAYVLLQKAGGQDRVKKYRQHYGEVRTGSQWISVTDAFVRYLLEREEDIRTYFMNCVAADELFVQSMCWNSPFREKIYPGKSIRLIDWERGKPYTWQEDDLEEILASGCLFVRKVTSENRLADLIRERQAGEEV